MVLDALELPAEDALCRPAALLTPGYVLDVARDELARLDTGPPEPWQHCRVVEAFYHPRRYVRIAVALLTDASTPSIRFWPDGQIAYFHWPARHPVSRRGAVVRLGDQDAELYLFPNDRRLRGLRHFTGRAAVARLWQEWGAQSGVPDGADTEALRRVLIRYVPEQKLVARIQADTLAADSDAAHRLNLAVRVSPPAICCELAQRYRTIAALARRADTFLYVPRVVGVDPTTGVLATEWVRGRSLLEKLQTGDHAQVMRRVARTLRAFHRLPAAGLEPLSNRVLLHRIRNAVFDLGLVCPELQPRLRTLAAEMRARVRGFVTVEPVTLHNDLHWNQVRIRQRRYALLDLERLCAGDPLVDAANFATQVRMLGQRPEHDVTPADASRWAAAFLEQWAAATRTPIASDRFHTFAALALLELARGMMRHFRPGWRALAQCCVEQAEAELNSIGREAIAS